MKKEYTYFCRKEVQTSPQENSELKIEDTSFLYNKSFTYCVLRVLVLLAFFIAPYYLGKLVNNIPNIEHFPPTLAWFVGLIALFIVLGVLFMLVTFIFGIKCAGADPWEDEYPGY